MALTNYERIGRALDLLKSGLGPFVEREVQAYVQQNGMTESLTRLSQDERLRDLPISDWDAAALLKAVTVPDLWKELFRKSLGEAERSYVNELREVRNRWAHQQTFTGDDAERALDTAARLLAAVSAPEADEVRHMKAELSRLRVDEQVRRDKRTAGGSVLESASASQLPPWREVVKPHRDVASGRYQQAEFAADLWQVHIGEGADEYRDPAEFFRRTYLTESLRALLAGAVCRLSGNSGDPVVNLQTNFGGGKTHSMLALYHLVSGTPATRLSGVDDVLARAGQEALPTAKRVVLVGNKISPGNPSTKPDGTEVRTLWGELAWQLGGREAYERIRRDDEHATNPGDVLRDLFNDYGPCLVLVDEWVAYARQLGEGKDLPGGDFGTQFTFAQSLTEAAKLADRCLLVVSLPASDTSAGAYATVDSAEVGGARGREALNRLENVINRVASSWRPASAEESFEIVRRRLFEPLDGAGRFRDRDVVARAFSDLYRAHAADFPADCQGPDYERRIQAAYPIHPEVFDRLYTDWSTLVKFQRTRGVLRMMAAVVHSLWEAGDRSPLILPASLPVDDARVQSELTRYLADHWAPIIEKDVDGPASLPRQIDGNVPSLGTYTATRRVARTVYLGSAPTTGAANRGLEDRRIRLGTVMPGEPPAVFGDALRRLAASATYLYQDGSRYWYDTQPTVTKLAADRAEALRRDPDAVTAEVEKRLRADLAKASEFSRVHSLPASGADVPDAEDARLVVLTTQHAHTRDGVSDALAEAQRILESRGSGPRIYRNTLVFLAADKTRLAELDDAVRHFLAWQSIVAEKEQLEIGQHQARQAEAQKAQADAAVVARLPETYQWLLVPAQSTPTSAVEWRTSRLSGQESLAARAARKLKADEGLVGVMGGSVLRMHLDRVPLWRNGRVSVRQLVADMASYLYLPRLRGPEVVARAIESGVGHLAWETDGFAYAEAFDETTGRFRGLTVGQNRTVNYDDPGLVVHPELARKQLSEEASLHPPPSIAKGDPSYGGLFSDGAGATTRVGEPGSTKEGVAGAIPLRRYHGSVQLDPARAGLTASKVAEEVLAHLVGLYGATVRVTLEIEADIPGGVPEHVVRTVTENGRTLQFKEHGFTTE